MREASDNDFQTSSLLWLALVLDDGPRRRADDSSRISDLGAVARDGLAAEAVAGRADEVLERATRVLAARDFDPAPLEPFRRRLDTGRLPADDLIAHYERERSIPAVLRGLDALLPAETAGADHAGGLAV